MKIKVLNLYAGIGGNRKLWKNVDVTAVENNEEIANIYKDFFPEDNVIITDAHQFLLEHFQEFDFIWSSPPCPSHSKFRFMTTKMNHPSQKRPIIYPDMNLYQEIIILKHYFKGKWVVENVRSYYEPLIEPQICSRHYFWSNFNIPDIKIQQHNFIKKHHNALSVISNFDLSNYKIKHRKDPLLRNCVLPELGLHIFESAYKTDGHPVQKLLSVSPTSQTSPKGDFSEEKEHNISLKDNSNELSQISSNDETSLNNNIKLNRGNRLQEGLN